MEIILAAAAAWVYGLGDYCGGRASRRADSFAVTFVGQIFSVLVLGVALVVLADPVAPMRDWIWGAAGGAGGFVGLSMFYYALAKGSMTVVAPTTAVVSAVVPAVAGFGFGERPSIVAYVGVVVAIVGVALVSGAVGVAHVPTSRRIMAIAALGGCGFGWMFVCLDRTGDDSGMWPLLAARIASISIAAVVVFGRRTSIGRSFPKLALLAGVFDMGANVLFLLANREGLLTLVSVITALYPVSTIVLAMRFDRERANRSQIGGMVLAGLALTLVAIGR
jgi:drug/metabolite transporter (DMT)-like permease